MYPVSYQIQKTQTEKEDTMKPVSRNTFVLVGFMIAALLSGADRAANAASTTYPDKSRSVNYICPYPPGGSADVSARIISALLEKEMGIPVIVVNKSGAGGQVGVTELARSRPDGYAIGTIVFPTVITTYNDPDRKAIYSRKSFELLASYMKDPGIIAVKEDSPYKTMKDLMDAAKANPESIRTTTAGILSDDHIAAMMAQEVGGVKFSIVHFDGATPGRVAVLGGHVEAYFGNASEIVSQVRGGQMRILAVMDHNRSPFYPDVKTAEEQGYPIFSGVQHGLAMPAGAPKQARDFLVEALKRVIPSDEFTKQMTKVALQPLYRDPQEYSAFWSEYESEIVKWVAISKSVK
jgi:tripartite-type tricarboxylate transporter receptor subunit TctC